MNVTPILTTVSQCSNAVVNSPGRTAIALLALGILMIVRVSRDETPERKWSVGCTESEGLQIGALFAALAAVPFATLHLVRRSL